MPAHPSPGGMRCDPSWAQVLSTALCKMSLSMAGAVVSQVVQCEFVQMTIASLASRAARVSSNVDVQKEEQEWWFEVVILPHAVGPAEAGREVYRRARTISRWKSAA